MPAKLSTTVTKIQSIPNKTNAELVRKYYQYMKENGSSERHLNNQLKSAIAFTTFLGSEKTLFDIAQREDILAFLETKIKSEAVDPEKKWITTYNDYLHRVKRLLRWLHNQHGKEELVPESEWQTPAFAMIREKKTKRFSPYSESEIWDKEELLTIVKYATNPRDKAALTLFWDLDARNHEVTMLKIKNIRLRERYGEGEIPPDAKTGSGPILLTCSFPHVRDWLNIHPDKNNPEAPIICSLVDGRPLRPEAMWQMMKERLRSRIIRLLQAYTISDEKERSMLEYLVKTKRWNPYCIRHSAITYDGDSLPEFALRKKVRWSMNSKQPARYMKRRMGNTLKNQILAREGIMPDELLKPKPSVAVCPKCNEINSIESKFCQKCSYPLSHEAFEEIKAQENESIGRLREQLKTLQEAQDKKMAYILSLIQLNPKLAHIKVDILKNLEVMHG